MSADPGSEGDILSTAAAGPAAARGGGLRVGGYIVGALFSVISASLLTRHLGVVQFGEYVTALSLVAIVGALSDLGLDGRGRARAVDAPARERWPLARDLLGLRITLTLIGSVAIVAIAWLAYSPTLAAGVALACVGLLLQATQDNFALPLLSACDSAPSPRWNSPASCSRPCSRSCSCSPAPRWSRSWACRSRSA